MQQDERNTLAAEVERLRGQLQGRPSPGRGGRDDQISHDWRTEEIDRLRSEVGQCIARLSVLPALQVTAQPHAYTLVLAPFTAVLPQDVLPYALAAVRRLPAHCWRPTFPFCRTACVQLGGTQRRNAELQDALRDRDALVERLRGTIRELQVRGGAMPGAADAGI